MGHERETEKSNLSGYAAKSFLRIVDLPEPDGPLMTMGWKRFCSSFVGAMVPNCLGNL